MKSIGLLVKKLGALFVQNIPYEEWYKYSKLKICSLEWNFVPKFIESSSEYPRVDFWQKIPELRITSGFNNYHKITVRDHIRVPNFSYVTYEGKYQKAYIRPQTFYLVIFLKRSPKLVLI